jgi:hypothetical protein
MALGARSQQVVSSIARGVAALIAVGTGIGLFFTVLLMLVMRAGGGSADVGIGHMSVYTPEHRPACAAGDRRGDRARRRRRSICAGTARDAVASARRAQARVVFEHQPIGSP